MKRSTIAMAACLGLCACSGQRNENLDTINIGRRDAAADARPAEDGEDAGAEQDADLERDAGTEDDPPVDASGSATDASDRERDAGAAGDAGVQSGDAATAQLDAGGNADQLRIRLVYETQFLTQASIFFGYADGGVESTHATDSEGLLVSNTAPAMFTVVLPSRNGTLNDHYDVVTVVAPALGDLIVIDPPAEQQASTQAIRYLATIGAVPAGGYGVAAYAGIDGCAQGYQDLLPAPTSAMQIGQRPTCQLESNGFVIAAMFDEPGTVLRYAGALLPAAAATPVAFTLDQWLVPEDLTLRLLNAASLEQPEANLWLRKGAVKVRVVNASPSTLPFKVARSIVDSFEAASWFARSASASEHLFGKNRPASAAEITFDLNEALPELDRSKSSATYLPQLRPSASWGVQGGSTPADALVSVFTWNWQPNSDTTASLTWRFVAPPDTTSVTVPELPNSLVGAGPLVPAGANVHFDGVEYYDSDGQNGYREFLRERLRPGSTRSEGGFRTGDLAREIPLGGNTRMARTPNVQP